MAQEPRPTTWSLLVINNVNLQIGTTISPVAQPPGGLSFLRAEVDITNHTDPQSFFELECDISYDGGVSWPVNKVTNDQCIFFAPGRFGGVAVNPVMSCDFDLYDPVTGAARQTDADTRARLVVTVTNSRLRTGGTIYGG